MPEDPLSSQVEALTKRVDTLERREALTWAVFNFLAHVLKPAEESE